MKRVLLLLLALLLMTWGAAAETAPAVLTSGNYSYILPEDGMAEIVKCFVKRGSVQVPAELNGVPVTSIGANAFRDQYDIESVILPEGVTTIRSHAFVNCYDLTAITLPQSLTTIETYAFEECGFESLTIPGGVRVLPTGAFSNCSALETLVISEGVELLEPRAIPGSSDLHSLTLPVTLTMTDVASLPACGNLKEIILPADHPTLELVDGALFPRETRTLLRYPSGDSRSAYTVPEGTAAIADSAFYGSTYLESVFLPDSVVSIGDSAFYRCDKLSSVTLPQTVTALGTNAFSETASNLCINIPAGLTDMGRHPFGLWRFDHVTRYVTPGTAGEAYAQQNDLHFEYVDATGLFRYSTGKDGSVSVTGCIGRSAFLRSKALVLTVVSGSAAEQYAIENNVPYVVAD